MQQKILIASNSRQLIETLRTALEARGHEALAAYGPGEALKRLDERVFHLLIAGGDIVAKKGQKFLQTVEYRFPRLPLIHLEAPSARAMGSSPVLHSREINRLLHQADALLGPARPALGPPPEFSGPQDGLLGESAAIGKLRHTLLEVARTDATVLLKGETGTGKKLAARFLHANSPRAAAPLVTVNCGALAPSLLESELFGHEKGSFTGAHQQKLGKFEYAAGGTLFLDEIGEFSAELQTRMLRVIDDREFERVGGNRTLDVKCRIIAASHIDFEQAMAEGRFREDLFHRLNVIAIEVPPLRDRRDDIPLLVDHFLAEKAARHGKPPLRPTDELLRQLMDHPWPGNVRELENILERAAVLATAPRLSRVDLSGPAARAPRPARPRDLPDDLFDRPLKAFRGRVLEIQEGEYFHRLLGRHRGHITRAAAAAGIDRKTFYRKIRRYGIDPGRYKKRPRL
jgi:DNA-binding NtrC family response regulator